MEIDEKLHLARAHARKVINAANWRGRSNGGTSEPARHVLEAYAILDICDEVERLRNELEGQRERRIRQVFEHR